MACLLLTLQVSQEWQLLVREVLSAPAWTTVAGQETALTNRLQGIRWGLAETEERALHHFNALPPPDLAHLDAPLLAGITSDAQAAPAGGLAGSQALIAALQRLLQER